MAVQKQGYPWVPVAAESFGSPVLPWGSAFHTNASYRGNALFSGDVTCESNFHVEGTLYSNESIYDTVLTNRIQPASEDRGIKIYDGESDWMWFHANRSVSIGSEAPEHLNARLFVDGELHCTELHTDYIVSDRTVQIPSGILTDAITAGDVVCKKTVSERVMTTFGAIDYLDVLKNTVLDGDVQANRNMNIQGTLDVQGSSELLSARIIQSLDVGGTIIGETDLRVSGTVELGNPFSHTTIHGPVTIRGDTHLQQSLIVDTHVQTPMLRTNYLISQQPVQIPKGILTDTIVAGDVVCKKTVSERVMSTYASHDHIRVTHAMAESADAGQVTNAIPIDNALEKVQALHGVTFQKPDSIDPRRVHLGLVAQDVEPHVPEVVFGDDNGVGPKYVAYGNLVPLLLESIKELKAQVNAQATTIQTLQAALDTP